jgi:hypothetical protein
MKKLCLVLSTLAVLIIVILSCKKNQDLSSSQVNSPVLTDQTSQNMQQRILAFKSQIENHLKTGSTMPIDTAVRYTEALVNYTYADVANNLMGLSVDSVYINVSLTNGKVSTLEASSVYNKIVDSLTVQYENLPSQNLHLIFADVFSKDSTTGHVKFGIISAFGYGSTINYGNFDQDKDWWIFGYAWANAGGYCEPSPYAGTHTNDDGAGQIERRIRLNIGVPSGRKSPYDVVTLQIVPDGTIYYFEGDEYYTCGFDNPNDQPPLDNYLDYMMYYKYSRIQQNFDPCTSPTELNFYWHGTSDVCTDSLYVCPETQALLAGKVFMSIHIIGDNDTGDPYYHYQHRLINTYGVWLTNPNNPEKF